MKQIVTKSELAAELGCSRSTLSRLCERGAPMRKDGRLERVKLLEYIAHSTSGVKGGWGAASGTLDLSTRAKNLLKGRPAIPPAEPKRGRRHQETTPQPDPQQSSASGTDPEEDVLVLNKDEFRKLHTEIRQKAFREGIFHAMNEYRRPGNKLEIANLALGFGCTPAVAFAVAEGYDLLLALWTVTEKDGPVVEYGDEPDWKTWAKRAGVQGDPEAWEREAKHLFNHWVKGPPEPSGKAAMKRKRSKSK